MKLLKFLSVYDSYRDIRPSTLDQYRWCVACFGRHLGREPRLSDLCPDRVNAWLRGLRDTHSPFTARSRRMTMISLWNLAHELGHVARPKLIRTVAVPARTPQTLTAQQVEALLRECGRFPGLCSGYRRSDLLRTAIQATLETAMRPGDLFSLEWPWVRDTFGQLTLVQQKRGRSRRVRFSTELLSDIASWHSEDGLIWPTGSRNTPRRWLQEVAESCGLVCTWTTLRKTAITDVEAQRPGTGWIFAGHTSPATTRDWYTDHSQIDVPRPRF